MPFPRPDLLPSPTTYPSPTDPTVALELALPYQMGGYVGFNLELSYGVFKTAGLGGTETTTYGTGTYGNASYGGEVIAGLALPYKLRVLAELSLALPYRVLSGVGFELEFPYRVWVLPHFRSAPGTHLTWELCDLTGNRLANITQRSAASIEFALNDQSAASVNINLEDKEAVSVVTLSRLLRVKMDGVPLFTGYIVSPKFNSESNAVEIRAFDPFWRLKEKAQVGMKGVIINPNKPFTVGNFNLTPFEGYTTRSYRFQGVEQSEIMWRLIRHAFPTLTEGNAGVPHFGVKIGAFLKNSSVDRDREYDFGKSIGEALQEMTQVINGPDFEFRPLDASVDETDTIFGVYNQRSKGWRHWQFNTFKPFMGTDQRPRVRFEYNTGLDNASAFSWEPDGLIVANRATWQGQSIEGQEPAQEFSNQPESQLAYGIYAKASSDSEIIFATTLKEHADEYTAAHAFPPDFFDFTPVQADGSGFRRNPGTGKLERIASSHGKPFIFGPDSPGRYSPSGTLHDFWIGDIISMVARFGKQADGTFAVDITDHPRLSDTKTQGLTGRITDAKITEVEGGTAHVTEVTCAPQIKYAGVV